MMQPRATIFCADCGHPDAHVTAKTIGCTRDVSAERGQPGAICGCPNPDSIARGVVDPYMPVELTRRPERMS